ncbi:hypothetical protein ABIB66_003411 [Bradyrhizobium sp. F1.13.3]|jgi:hypothetical protein
MDLEEPSGRRRCAVDQFPNTVCPLYRLLPGILRLPFAHAQPSCHQSRSLTNYKVVRP